MRLSKVVFADAAGFVAAANPRDKWPPSAARLLAQFRANRVGFLTTSYVIDETVTGLTGVIPHTRIVEFVDGLFGSRPAVRVLHVSEAVEQALQRRPDKVWSLTDCVSFVTMAEYGLQEALTSDHNFGQAGLVALMVG